MSTGNDPSTFFNNNPAGYQAEMEAWAERLFQEAMDAEDDDNFLKKIDEMSDEEVCLTFGGRNSCCQNIIREQLALEN